MLLITLLASASSSAFAATVNTDIALNVTATAIGHQFTPSYTVDYLTGSSYGAVTIPPFSANLSQLNNFSLTVSAPSGYDFLVHSAGNSTGMVLSYTTSWIASGWNGGLTDYTMPTVSFNGAAVPAWYNDTTSLTIDKDGNGVNIDGGLFWMWQTDFRFSSVTISANLSSFNGRNYSNLNFPTSNQAIRFLNVLPNGTRVDPGASVILVPKAVPLPPSILLFMSSLMLPLMSSFRKRPVLEG